MVKFGGPFYFANASKFRDWLFKVTQFNPHSMKDALTAIDDNKSTNSKILSIFEYFKKAKTNKRSESKSSEIVLDMEAAVIFFLVCHLNYCTL